MIKKIALVCIRDKKMLIVHKKTIDMFISPGGKIEEGEGDEDCLRREVYEELGCKVYDAKYWKTYLGNVSGSEEKLELKCYFGRLSGEIRFDPKDNIDSCKWIGRNYKTDFNNGMKLPSLLEEKVIPDLIKEGIM